MGSVKPFDVIVAGELFVDLIMSGFDFWPQPGREAFASEFHREIGGGAAITACGLAKLGSRTSVLGIVGLDNGAWIIEQLQASGVETSDIRFHPTEPTAFTVAATMQRDRAFLTYAGANRGFPAMLMEVDDRGPRPEVVAAVLTGERIDRIRPQLAGLCSAGDLCPDLIFQCDLIESDGRMHDERRHPRVLTDGPFAAAGHVDIDGDGLKRERSPRQRSFTFEGAGHQTPHIRRQIR